MSKKHRHRANNSHSAAAAPAAPAAAEAADGAISKAQKRKLQKKRAKEAARAQHDAEAKARADQKAERKAARAAAAPAASEPHPVPQPLAFAAAEDDHCETAPEAYAHVAGLLRETARALGIEPSALRIYDPYFCNGAVARHLAALGFPLVHNRNEDFYEVVSAGAVPPHDVLLTNPPYSDDHPERLLDFMARNGKPWLALMPNWVCTKPYYDSAGPGGSTAAKASGHEAFYIVPRKRYNYWTPRGRRSDVAAGGAKAKTHGHTNAALGVRTSPFVSFWYCGGAFPAAVRRELEPPEGCRLCHSKAELPLDEGTK